MSGYAYDLAVEQGFKPWRHQVTSGIEIWRREWSTTRVRCYIAFRGHDEVGRWSIYDGPGGSPCGHIGGDFSKVQGQRAPCTKLADWLAQVGVPTAAEPIQLELDREVAAA